MRRLLILLLLFLLIPASWLFAAWDGEPCCIELGVGTADCVVIGHIVRVGKVAPTPSKPTKAWTSISVQIGEVLVGAVQNDHIDFVMPNDGSLSFSPSSTQKLFVLVKGSRYVRFDADFAAAPLTLFAAESADPFLPFELTPAKLREIPNMTLKRFQSQADLMAAIAPYCARPIHIIRMEEISTASPVRWEYELVVPVDERSEILAEQWIQSNDPELRFNGVRVLRWLKSKRNIELFEQVAQLPPVDKATEVAREMARITLNTWGAPAPVSSRFAAPSWHEIFEGHLWVSVFVFAFVPFAFWKLTQSRSKQLHNKFWRGLAVGWLVLFIGVAILWGRSYFNLDGFCAGGWQVAGMRGDVFAVKCIRLEGNVDWPWEYCRPYEMVTIAQASERRWDWSNPRWYLQESWGPGSYVFDAPPDWPVGLAFRVPFWLIEAIFLVVPTGILGIGWARSWIMRYRVRRAAGFPVSDTLPS